MGLALKALVGAAAVVVIQFLSSTKNYYLAALVPLFPTFTLIAFYILGTERTTVEVRSAIQFGMLSLVPYLAFLVSLYLLVSRLRLGPALAWSTGAWLAAALVLTLVWRHAVGVQ